MNDYSTKQLDRIISERIIDDGTLYASIHEALRAARTAEATRGPGTFFGVPFSVIVPRMEELARMDLPKVGDTVIATGETGRTEGDKHVVWQVLTSTVWTTDPTGYQDYVGHELFWLTFRRP